MRKRSLGSLFFGLLVCGMGVPSSAFGQARPAPGPVRPAATTPTAPLGANVSELVRFAPNGLTAETVGTRAAATSFTAKASDEQLRAAAARVDQAWANFLPRLTLTARYTRLSSFTPPSLGGPGGFVVTNAPEGTQLLPEQPGPNAPLAFAAGSFSFPIVLNNYLLSAAIAIPLSDYFLRINEGYSAATRSEEAARFDTMSARARSYADGKIAYYNWLRTTGAVVVAEQALTDQKVHLTDARNQFTVGNASRADVLRAETAVAAAEVQVERAKNLAQLAEKQVRIAMHVGEAERFAVGENLDASLPSVGGNLADFTREALSNRPEVKSIDLNAEALRRQASAVRGGSYPSVSAFGEGIYANPNQRRFPQTQDWFPTWAVGAQLVWTPNDILAGGAGASEFEARAAAALAQRGAVRDGIELEVTQAYQSIREAEVATEASKRELASATEAYRVARELFNNGRATSTTLTDAESELTRARLDALNAAVDARLARVRLDHALGRDARAR